MPREPAYAAERSHEGEAKAASERTKNRMFGASVRLSGRGQPRRTTYWRTTRRISHQPQSSISRLPAQTAIGGTLPAFA